MPFGAASDRSLLHSRDPTIFARGLSSVTTRSRRQEAHWRSFGKRPTALRFIKFGKELVALHAGIASFSVTAPLRVVGGGLPLGTFLPQFFMTRFRVSYIDRTIRERFVDAPTAGDAEDIVYEEISESVHHHLVESWIDDFSASEVSAKEAEKTSCSLCSC